MGRFLFGSLSIACLVSTLGFASPLPAFQPSAVPRLFLRFQVLTHAPAAQPAALPSAGTQKGVKYLKSRV